MFRHYIRTCSNFNLYSNKNLLFRKSSLNYFSINKTNILQNVVKSNYFVTTNLSKNDNIIKVYSGPLSGTARKLKILSMASLIGTIAISPFIIIVNAPIGLGARIIFIIMAISTSALSTGLIHLCFSPYVRNIFYNPSIPSNQSSDTSEISSLKITPDSFLTFETLTLFCRSNFTTLPIKSLEPSFRFFTTWKVKKPYENELIATTKKGKQLKSKKLFYVHSELCDNKVMQEVIKKVGIN
ncbi:hypothetical protein RclHR1_01910023 [Rhizophagus clarus]|uniref:Transmembrane protein 186 n=1 Tax=Rhizophagus clarus TaxID=94130 RepID=A0A2Z6R137_9GLOM|nr:hypothetical protein RclHR1_01910023 [Rhizophagus clarus]GES82773.1 hypothetical protein RCL_jg11580.t1 [Rhizophagus clarus]